MSFRNVVTIIVSYNGIKWIDNCLSSLINSNVKTDVIAVDNGSTDGTLAYLKQCKWLTYLHASEENLGFGKANNIGLEIAHRKKYKYIFLLNQDAWVESNTLEELIVSIQQNPEYGIVSPMHLNGKGTGLDFYFESYLQRTPGFLEDEGRSNVKKLYQTPFVNAASWLLTWNTLNVVGLFHPLFDHYGEDDNYIDRVHYQNLKVGIVTSVNIYHDRVTPGENPLKDNLKKLFKRTLLQKLLKPGNSYSFAASYQISNKIARRLVKNQSFARRWIFQTSCLIEFFEVYKAINEFDKLRKHELRTHYS